MKLKTSIFTLTLIPISSIAATCMTPETLSQHCWHGKDSQCPSSLQSKSLNWGNAISHDPSRLHFQSAQWVNGLMTCMYGVNLSGTPIAVYTKGKKKMTRMKAPRGTFTEIGYGLENVPEPHGTQWSGKHWQCVSNTKRCSVTEFNGSDFRCRPTARYHKGRVVWGQALKTANEVDCLYYGRKPKINAENPFRPSALVFNTVDMPKATVKYPKHWKPIPLTTCQGKESVLDCPF